MEYDSTQKGMVCTVCKAYGKVPVQAKGAGAVQAKGAWVTQPVNNWMKATHCLVHKAREI